MREYHKKGPLKGAVMKSKFNRKEHLEHVMEVNYVGQDANGCQYVDCYVSDTGYPMVWHRGKDIKITRLLAANYLGIEVEELDGGNHSWRHTVCSNSLCVNPNHGTVGIHKENCYDGDKGSISSQKHV